MGAKGAAVFIVMALGAVACGSSPSPLPSPSPSAQPTTRTVIALLAFTLPAGSATFNSLDAITPGTIDAQLDWGSAANDLNLYATDLACPGFPELRAGQCRVLAQAVTNTKPERLTFVHATLGDFRLWVHNTSASGETVQLEIGVTR